MKARHAWEIRIGFEMADRTIRSYYRDDFLTYVRTALYSERHFKSKLSREAYVHRLMEFSKREKVFVCREFVYYSRNHQKNIAGFDKLWGEVHSVEYKYKNAQWYAYSYLLDSMQDLLNQNAENEREIIRLESEWK